MSNLSTMLFSFDGRMRRRHWWLIQLGLVAGVIAAFAIMVIMDLADSATTGRPSSEAVPPWMQVFNLTLLLGIVVVTTWTGLATSVKRFHDRDMSGWFVLLGLIPGAGGLILLIFNGFLDGTMGPNRFGHSPKAENMSQIFF